jgi:chemotaxis protein CheC
LSIKLSYQDWEIDALTEICNIGAGHAATALAQLLDDKVMISVPNIELVELSRLPDAIGGAETWLTAVCVRVLGDVPGTMLFMLPREDAVRLAAVLQNRDAAEDQLTEDSRKIIQQAGFVVISSYLSALTCFLEIPLIPSEAGVADDMAGALVGTIIANLDTQADHALVVQTEFIDESINITAKICFLPEPQGQQVIMDTLRAGRD